MTNALLGGSGGATYGSYNDVNQDGKRDWQDQVSGAMIGVAGMYGVQKAGDAIAPLIPKGFVDRLNATKTIAEAADVIAKGRFKPAKRMERAATEADWEDAVSEASEVLRTEAKRQGGGVNVAAEMVPDSLTDPNGKPLVVYEELAAKILRSKGLDPNPVYSPMLAERGTNAENAKFSKVLSYEVGQAKAANRETIALDEGDDTDAAISVFESLKPPPRLNGFGGANTQNALAGGFLGGIAPAETPEDRARNIAVGLGLGAVSGKLGKSRNALAGDAASAGKAAPKTAQQAAKFETPGSPEWEAAKAKGLDMSQAGRMARAKEMGFDTETVLYHGTEADFDQFSVAKAGSGTDDGFLGVGVYLTPSPEVAGSYATSEGAVMPLFARLKSGFNRTPADYKKLRRHGYKYDVEPIIAASMEVRNAANASGATTGVLRRISQEFTDAAQKAGFDHAISRDGLEVVIFDPANIRSVNAAFDPDKAASPILTAGAGGGKPRAPKADSPEAIRNALKGIAKPKPEPTRLERMVEEGKDADVPPIRTTPDETTALGAQAKRMEERGLSPIEIYDQTGVAMIPYNGGSVPIVSPSMGPEELTRKFYAWLAEPAAKRPEWVNQIISSAPRKKGLMLTERERILGPVPQQANALAEQPLPKAGFPGGAVVGGALAGAATGIPAGVLAGTMIAREQDRKRNALAQ